MERKMIVDLFCGAGGASEGIRLALGRSPDLAFDHWDIACQTHKANHGGETICADIRTINKKEIKKYTKRKAIKLLWASPPCTEFSIANNSAKEKNEITNLIYTPITWADNADIETMAIENVPDLVNYDHYKILLDKLVKKFNRIETHILKHSDCGGATMRKRLFIIARNTNFNLCFDKQKSKSAADYLDENNKAWKPLITKDVRFLEAVKKHDPLNIVNADFICTKALRRRTYPISGLFPTITTVTERQIYLINAEKTHYRAFGANELAALQGFDSYIFEGSKTNKTKQIGNSVPPSMAYTVIKALDFNRRKK
jgi:site-specific DNA-cytosine methylase